MQTLKAKVKRLDRGSHKLQYVSHTVEYFSTLYAPNVVQPNIKKQQRHIHATVTLLKH